MLLYAAFLAFGIAVPAAAPDPVEAPPVEVFAELDGSWAGTFVGWGSDGAELYRIAVRQSYRTLDANTQEVEIVDTLADGTVIRGRGVNTARRRADGSLELGCRVEKSNGETAEHRGRLVRGPDGSHQILWTSADGERAESFRERVVREGEETVYRIDGMGRYGDTLVLMAGRYVKQ